jgi:Coenzyme PQQ synthesis protein D (PqqD)
VSSKRIRFRPSPDVVASRAGEEVVVVDLKTDRIYSLNRTAARAWELFCADCERAEVEHRMLEEFDVESGELTNAIDDLLDSLTRNRLLLRCE